jgi:N-acetyltransferase
MTWLKPVTLAGQYATLKPLSLAYHDDLITAVQDGELWKLWYTNVPEPGSPL